MLASSNNSTSREPESVRPRARLSRGVDAEYESLFFEVWWRKQFGVEKSQSDQADNQSEAKTK